MIGRAVFAAAGGVELAFPECEKGIGSVISSLDSANLIEGVGVTAGAIWPDDRGYFLEVLRMGKGPVSEFPLHSTQISAALSYPGTIKAFHYHLHQTDYWTVAAGMLQVALADLRRDSPTFGRRNTFYVGTSRPWQITIPPGVAHGYKVIGTEAALLVYATNRFYDPSDEGRIAFDDSRINYSWDIQHK